MFGVYSLTICLGDSPAEGVELIDENARRASSKATKAEAVRTGGEICETNPVGSTRPSSC